MISVSTFDFVLALAVVASAAVGWIISSRLTAAQALQQSTTDSYVRNLRAQLAQLQKDVSEARRAAPASLAAEVADLREAVERLRKTHQRFAGRFDAARAAPKIYDGENGQALEGDDEVQAMLALQRAKPAGPAKHGD